MEQIRWIQYSQPGQRQLEAFGNGMRYNITELDSGIFALHVRRMNDPLAEHKDVLRTVEEAKSLALNVRPENLVRSVPAPEEN